MAAPETLFYSTHNTPIGTLLLVASGRALRAIRLLDTGADAYQQAAALYPHASMTPLESYFTSLRPALDAYFRSEAPLTLPYELAGGTPLQRMVWLALTKIPYGETISYSMLADRVGFPRAVRAVASACGANPLPLVIPCHRVVAKDGTLGGFSLGGLAVKEQLLALEATAGAVQAQVA